MSWGHVAKVATGRYGFHRWAREQYRVHLPSLDVQLVFMSVGSCVLCTGILGLEVYHYKSGWYITNF